MSRSREFHRNVARCCLALLLTACGQSSAPSPFVQRDAGSDPDAATDAATDAVSEASPADVRNDADPTLGGPCVDDGQCDDGVACSFDACDETVQRCRFTPDDSQCNDGVFCNGVEVCDRARGCIAGEPVSCSDDQTCTIDSCDEATAVCQHHARDADGDGDPVWNCPGGGDCNDTEPRVSSLASEVCGNARDDDCDGDVDEGECQSPAHDTCFDPLLVDQAGVYSLSMAAAASDYSATCGGTTGTWRDLVVAIAVPEGPAVDVDVVATAMSGTLALAAQTLCGDASSETACGGGMALPTGGAVSRLVLSALEPGNHALVVYSTADSPVTLKVAFRTPQPPPQNETCGTAADLAPGVVTTARVTGALVDTSSECGGQTGDLVYRFELAQAQDVHLYATSLDGLGLPVLSLRGDDCATTERTCNIGANAHVFWRALAGVHYVAVSATGPTDMALSLELDPPSAAPADESCENPPLLAPDGTVQVPLTGHVDDVHLGCLAGAVDAAYALDVSEPSDVLLVSRLSQGDTAAISLAAADCSADTRLTCSASSLSPVRSSTHALTAGSYRVVSESLQANPMTVTAFVRAALPAVAVPFADGCADALVIPPEGGFFQGNTANAKSDYAAGCDLGAQSSGARDQMLELVLSETKRVVLDMRGSAYATLLAVRRGPNCPGTEVFQGCSAGYAQDRSFLDLTLEPGEYFIQIDGYAGGEGMWFLDAYVVNP